MARSCSRTAQRVQRLLRCKRRPPPADPRIKKTLFIGGSVRSHKRGWGQSDFVCGCPTRTQKTLKALFRGETPPGLREPRGPLAPGAPGAPGPEKLLGQRKYIEKYCLNCLYCPCARCTHGATEKRRFFVTTDTFAAEKCLLHPGPLSYRGSISLSGAGRARSRCSMSSCGDRCPRRQRPALQRTCFDRAASGAPAV